MPQIVLQFKPSLCNVANQLLCFFCRVLAGPCLSAIRRVHVGDGPTRLLRPGRGVEGARRGQQRPLPGLVLRQLVLRVMYHMPPGRAGVMCDEQIDTVFGDCSGVLFVALALGVGSSTSMKTQVDTMYILISAASI